MRSYPWFRLFSEARTDAKLRTLSDAEHRVWFGLLCMAAEQPQRGTITGRTDEVLALEVSGGDVALLRQTVTRLVQLQILSDGGADGITFVHFQDRQHDYPSDLPEATRARKQAQRSRVVTSVSRDVTSGHEGEKNRKEEKREERSEVGVDQTITPSGSEPTTRARNAPRASKTPQRSQELQRALECWRREGLGPVSQRTETRLKALIAAHGVELLENGIGKAAEQDISNPAAWLESVLPAWERDRRRNGTNRGHPQGPPKPSKFDGFGITVEA